MFALMFSDAFIWSYTSQVVPYRMLLVLLLTCSVQDPELLRSAAASCLLDTTLIAVLLCDTCQLELLELLQLSVCSCTSKLTVFTCCVASLVHLDGYAVVAVYSKLVLCLSAACGAQVA